MWCLNFIIPSALIQFRTCPACFAFVTMTTRVSARGVEQGKRLQLVERPVNKKGKSTVCSFTPGGKTSFGKMSIAFFSRATDNIYLLVSLHTWLVVRHFGHLYTSTQWTFLFIQVIYFSGHWMFVSEGVSPLIWVVFISSCNKAWSRQRNLNWCGNPN